MSDELYHHGIKGQKWGHRRYQNPDGSLTPEGRDRYSRKVRKGGIIGAVAGAATGAGYVGLSIAQAAALGSLNVAAIPSVMIAYGLRYAASGYLSGLAISAIKNSAQIKLGQKYVGQRM